jgi:hypothetical protein
MMKTTTRRLQRAGLAALLLCAAQAQALTVDPKALARYDLGYQQCETLYPHMRGHRDEAYLSLWKVTSDAKSRAQLTAARKGATYQAERRRVMQAAAKGAAPSASGPIEQQCRGLWTEAQRRQKTAP